MAHFAQQGITDGVAERIVDDLEAIEIEEQHGHGFAIALGVR